MVHMNDEDVRCVSGTWSHSNGSAPSFLRHHQLLRHVGKSNGLAHRYLLSAASHHLWSGSIPSALGYIHSSILLVGSLGLREVSLAWADRQSM
jgi:hypothetical protein